jgi:ATP-dependent helicase HrpB
MTALPIDPVLPDLVAVLRRSPCAVVRAPTGAGKTTRVPPALLDSDLVPRGRILVLEPRRLAARAAAARMAQERGGQLGNEIGYHVRFDRRYGSSTRILTVTPGIVLRMLHHDPFLESTGAILFDEFHERSLESDLVLGMVRLVQQTVRPDLRVVVMSATLDVEPVAAYLDRCPIVVSEGRLHPVEIRHEPPQANRAGPADAARAAAQLLRETKGDLLVFLPGLAEIRQTMRHLVELASAHDLAVLPLYGDLPPAQQDAALLPGPRRKAVLATNVAETSVTVEGIAGVIDTGLARQLVYNPGLGLDCLRLTPISRASADQRAGRAGRTQPGICVRLWSELSHRARPERDEPEVRRVDLAGAVLQLLNLGETNLLRFPWLEPPRPEAVAQAQVLLRRLGAVSEHGITDLGRAMARLPVHPRIGRLLLEGQRLGQVDRVAMAAALLSERDPFARTLEQPVAERQHRTDSDLLDRIESLEEFEQGGRTDSAVGNLHRAAARSVLRARDQLRRELHHGNVSFGLPMQDQTTIETPASGACQRPDSTLHGALTQPRSGRPEPNQATEDAAVLIALLAAFPDRLARRREAGSRRGLIVGGRGVRLAPSSGVSEPELFLCLDVDAGQNEGLVRLASLVRREWLPADRMKSALEVVFDGDTEKVIARKRVQIEDLVIEDHPAPVPDNDTTAQILAAAAAEHLDKVLPVDESPAGMFRIRIQCLREWLPELNLPALTETELREILPWLCQGRRSFTELRQADWLGAMQARLTHVQRQALDREAPERLTVPSGSRIALHYQVGRPPILAVRIQELFGLRDTPRLAAGRVPVLLHLLAPNYRPQQVTDDLASFWANTYPQIRKELRARYPKHAWPDDPYTATPERRPQRKRPSP